MLWFNNMVASAPKKWHCSKRSPGAHWTGSERSSHVLFTAVYSRLVVGQVRWVSWNVRCYQNFRRRGRRYSFRVSIK